MSARSAEQSAFIVRNPQSLCEVYDKWSLRPLPHRPGLHISIGRLHPSTTRPRSIKGRSVENADHRACVAMARKSTFFDERPLTTLGRWKHSTQEISSWLAGSSRNHRTCGISPTWLILLGDSSQTTTTLLHWHARAPELRMCRRGRSTTEAAAHPRVGHITNG